MKRLYQTAFLVTAFSIFERGLGFLYRIILSRTLGSEGVGIYQIALSVFAVFLTAVSSGLPITVSRLITKYRAAHDQKGEQGCLTAAVFLTLLFALPLSLLLYLGHPVLDFLFADERCLSVFYQLLPGLTFTSVYAVLRGYFWGNKTFLTYSVIELLEEMVMIVVGTLLVAHMTDTLDGARKAGLAVTVSYLSSFSMAFLYFLCHKGKFGFPCGFRSLLSSAVPISVMRTSSSLLNSCIAVLFPLRLTALGMSKTEALSGFGIVFGMSIPVLSMPATIIGSIALVLVPELAESFYRKKTEQLLRTVTKALRVTTALISLLIPIFAVLGKELGILLFSNPQSGELIQYGSFLLLPMSLHMISTSMLNSIHCERQTLLFFLLGSIATLLCVWFLPAYCGVYALLIGMAASSFIESICNLLLLKKKIKGIQIIPHFLNVILLTMPNILLGFFLKNILFRYLGEIPAFLLSGIWLILCEFGLFFLFFRLFKGNFFQKRKTNMARSIDTNTFLP